MSYHIATFILLCVVVPAYAEAVEAPRLTSVDVSDSTCKISWETPASASTPGVEGYNVYMAEDSGRYIQLNDNLIKKPYVRLTNLLNGSPYHFAVTAVNSDGAESMAGTTGMVVPVGYSTKILSLKGGARAVDYHIFSTPLVTDRRSAEDFFAYMPPYDENGWRLFSLEREGFREFDDIKSIAPGKAYWFLSRLDTEIFISGETVDNYEPFYIQLHPGWNMIGSPFLYPVSWEEVLRKNRRHEPFMERAIWEFSGGGFKRASILKPFGGYYVYNASDGDMEILLPPSPLLPRVNGEAAQAAYYGGSGMNASYSDGGWMMKISADDGVYYDADNLIGIDARAAQLAGFGKPNRMDMAEPPAWPQHLSLYFAPGDEGVKLSSDIRKSGGAWKVIVEGGENSRVTIKWQTLSGSRSALLFDTAIERSVDMEKNGSYSFSRNGTAPREFFIRVD